MKRYVLTIQGMDRAVFDVYWYGYGTLISSEGNRHVVDYGEDKYRADIQCDRFASGLYFGTVEEITQLETLLT